MNMTQNQPTTLFDKIWDAHVVKHAEGHPDALFIDRHFIHEVTSPQAFDGLRKRGMTDETELPCDECGSSFVAARSAMAGRCAACARRAARAQQVYPIAPWWIRGGWLAEFGDW